ncbi:MAG: hypothetical protein J2P19_00340 [Pseudonocardia sp.]|nr:hypothetical protein [Pseudonocardia sp.]
MITATVEYAFNPRQGNRSNGAYHLVLAERLDSGRFHRDAGDALCRPRRKFWGLYEGNDSRADCKRCVELAARHGVAEVAVPR